MLAVVANVRSSCGYYFNVGCSDLIVKGEIGLAQFSDIASLVAAVARMRTGEPYIPETSAVSPLYPPKRP
jgi:hypothetical protein